MTAKLISYDEFAALFEAALTAGTLTWTEADIQCWISNGWFGQGDRREQVTVFASECETFYKRLERAGSFSYYSDLLRQQENGTYRVNEWDSHLQSRREHA